MKIYNTYSNKKEEFVPIVKDLVTMYICGPTVYNYIHIGNARPPVFFDTVKKYFIHKGYKVKMASNFTDLNEKILAESKIENIEEMAVANKYIEAYLNDLKFLNVDIDYIKPRVTECIDDIIKYIERLIEIGSAYQVSNDVYFRISSDPKYGSLSNRKVDELKEGVRIEVREEKESPLDFALWKSFNEGIVYDSPWGKGRPGWHTECSVMIDNIFDGTIDIHGGGSDLIFPHHENENSQNEVIHHRNLANYWVHNARINFGKEKMSKSLGNVIWVKDLKIDPRAFRLLILSFPYRGIISYTEELEKQFVLEYNKLESAYNKLFLYMDINNLLNESLETPRSKELLVKFENCLEDDFNTPNAISVVNETIKDINILLRNNNDSNLLVSLYNSLNVMLHILGLDQNNNRLNEEERDLYNRWVEARNNKDFNLADSLRLELKERNIII